MKITYFGHSCFKLETQTTSFLFDPFSDIGYDLKPTVADITLCSHDHFDHNAVHLVKTNHIINEVINEDVNGVRIQTALTFHDEVNGAKRGINRITKIIADNFTVVHLGDLGEITNATVDFIKNSDLLLIPVGGTYTIDATQAKELISLCNVKHVIPMHYKSANSRINISPLSSFTDLYNHINYLPSQIDLADLKDGINVMEIE